MAMSEIEAKSKIKHRIAVVKEIAGCSFDSKSVEDLEIAVQVLKEIREYREIGSVEECRENKDLLEFLYNQIQPNEMEQYLSMYRIKEKIPINGYADQSGMMSAT